MANKENMKSDSQDQVYSYGANGLNTYKFTDSATVTTGLTHTVYTPKPLANEIETVIKALGTMVIIPEFETNQVTFKKEQTGAIQQPILQGRDREIVTTKLIELISKL